MSGLKGRAFEAKKFEDHLALADSYEIDVLENGGLERKSVPMT